MMKKGESEIEKEKEKRMLDEAMHPTRYILILNSAQRVKTSTSRHERP